MLDNYSLGLREDFDQENIVSLDVDLSKAKDTTECFDFLSDEIKGQPCVIWHLAANSDIVSGIKNPNVDLNDTFMTTLNLLEACRKFGIDEFNFASSSAVYGDWADTQLIESLGPLRPISNYGAMKLASEALISAYTESCLQKVNIFRFPNVVGTPATHGVVLDFVRNLSGSAQNKLEVLGNGTQQKIYLHVVDLVAAILHVQNEFNERFNVINIGNTDLGVSVSKIAESVRDYLNPDAEITYQKSDKGWLGDVPRYSFDVGKLLDSGWRPQFSSIEAIAKTIEEIVADERG